MFQGKLACAKVFDPVQGLYVGAESHGHQLGRGSGLYWDVAMGLLYTYMSNMNGVSIMA